MADEIPYEPIPDAQPPGPQTTVTSGGDSTSSTAGRETPTAATTQAVTDANAANQAIPAATGAVGDAQEMQQAALADSQSEDADQKWRDNIDWQANANDWQDKIATANKDKQAAMDATKGLGYESMWAHASTGKKVLEGLGMLATGLSGNTDASKALNENIKNQVDADLAEQKANIDQKYEQARMRGEDVNQLYSQWEHENGMQAAKEQRSHEYIAAKALEAQTRAGIPLSKAQNHVVVTQQLADAANKNVEMQRAFDRKVAATTSKQLTPTETVVTGKPGRQITPGERKADAEQYTLESDAHPLLEKPLSADEKKAVIQIHKSMTPEKGGLEARAFDWTRDKLSGVNVDKMTPEQRSRVDAAVRVAGHMAKGSSPEAFAAALESSIPDDTDKSGRKKTALQNYLQQNAAGTPRPGYWAGKTKQESKPAPTGMVTPPPPGQLKKVMQDGVRGYLTPDGKFVKA